MATQVCESKLESETMSVQVDMLGRLAVGEVLVTVASAMSVDVGEDPTPSTMLVGVPTLEGSVVTQAVKGGIPGVIYKLALSGRTDVNNIVINEAKIAVLADDAAIPDPLP